MSNEARLGVVDAPRGFRTHQRNLRLFLRECFPSGGRSRKGGRLPIDRLTIFPTGRAGLQHRVTAKEADGGAVL
jgi:hypothetical protein